MCELDYHAGYIHTIMCRGVAVSVRLPCRLYSHHYVQRCCGRRGCD